MPILSGDIKLVASQVMDDVPEGGGAPTSSVIADGTSNAIFPDISELDRAVGRVNLRKLFVSVQTADTDTYMGANFIVAEPPADPNVSISVFSTDSVFDTRAEASSRVESYLNRGSLWHGFLFEDHIQGQTLIQLFQRPQGELPAVGQTLVLVSNEGLPNEVVQYVRTTEVTSVLRTFYDAGSGKDFSAAVVSCKLSDKLGFDFPGSPPTATFSMGSGKTKTRDTVVADAGTYAGVTPLAVAADLGDFTVAVNSIFSQLVPSAQTETAISDVRTNGLATALVATGAPVVQTVTLAFSTTQNLFVGGPIYPGSLSIVREGVTLIDAGGLLTNAGAEVGQVDYDNGIVSLSSNVWGAGGGSHSVTFVPAAVPDLVSDQRLIRITAESRSQSYAFTMDDIPVPRTLTLSYRAQGRWYVLRDNGAGQLKGNSTGVGVGTISYTTGSVVVSLGALPDVGSAIVIQSYSKVTTVGASNTMLLNGGRAYVPINTDGLLSDAKGAKTIKPGALSITWTDGTLKTVTDDGAGNLTGDASGTVNYGNGVVLLSPTVLPPSGTVMTMVVDASTSGVAVGVLIAGGSLGATNITPGSVSFVVQATITYGGQGANDRMTFTQRSIPITVFDDRAGNLYFKDGAASVICGTVTYAAGTINMTGGTLVANEPGGPQVYINNWYQVSWSLYQAMGRGTPTRSAAYTASANVSYSNTVAASNTITVTPTQYIVRSLMVPNYTLKGVGFTLGTTRYQQLSDGTLNRDIDPMTGGGTPAGSVSGAIGVVYISSWPVGAPSLITNWRGLIAPPSVGVEAPFTAFATIFRTASSPLRPSSLSILGTMQDGTTFNVTSDANGKINSTRVKGVVNYDYGLVELYFVNPAGDTAIMADLTHLGIAGLTTTPADLAMLTTLRYNAVSFSYLPLDATLLGIDPVRLPSDGRVPIFRAGGLAVVGHTGSITATVANAQVIDCARVRLSRVRVIGSGGVVINTGYSADLEAGTVTFSDITGYAQPVTIEHRIEDMAVINETQITGQITFTRALTHNYPLGSFVSSALPSGDLKARVSILFDQATWSGTSWLDAVSGTVATGTFNSALAPIVVTNKGAVSERWALSFTNSTSFSIIGEHVGVIGTGSINTETSPINPATGVPYFTVPILGWGTGWAVGNVLRLNTVGAMFPVWCVRTIQQGPNTGTEHSFTLLSRGDVDQP